MLESIADAIHGILPIRNRVPPIHRHSRERGHCEAGFWRPIGRRTAWRIVGAAKRFNCARKQSGRKNGPLGHIGIEILELFANLVDCRDGRLEPSIDWIAAKLVRSRTSIVAALAALQMHGFLDWLRRYVKTGDEGKGHPPRQISNAYRLVLPVAAAAMLGTPPPVPDDAAVARADAAALVAAQEREQGRLDLEESPLGASLARLGDLRGFRKFTDRHERGSDLESSAKR